MEPRPRTSKRELHTPFEVGRALYLLGFLGVRVKTPVGREIRPDYREEKYTQERSFSSAAPVLNYMTGNKTLRESARSLPLVFTKLQICPPRLTK